TMNALELLRNFLNRKQALAILLDEYGGVAGVVTLSDLLEELLGEEGASAQSELYIERIHADRLLASGNARLDDLGEFLGLDFKDENADTLGGLIVERLGQLPKPGASLKIDGWLITVRRVTRKRIRETLIERPAKESSTPEAAP
ncbi:MAG TPA: transporter associated domain-containing protein, partial [Chthoniobacterales bacterium]